MTANQIAYYRASEERRHNLVGEQQAGKQMELQNTQFYSSLGETIRHNKVAEQEANRHNYATEQINFITAQAQQSQAASAARQADIAQQNADTRVKELPAKYLQSTSTMQGILGTAITGALGYKAGKATNPFKSVERSLAVRDFLSTTGSAVKKSIGGIKDTFMIIPNAVLQNGMMPIGSKNPNNKIN